MLHTRWRNIPQTMGTQHPDNVNAPYWEKDGDGFVSALEEVAECASSFKDLGCEEYMWDWEGKYVDEAVIEKLLTEHHAFFDKYQMGKDRFLTFRIPNIWEEKGRSLARAFMNLLTAEEFAQDLKMHTPPIFEVILPMADKAEKLIEMQHLFTRLATFKHELFQTKKQSLEYIDIIPLIEGVHSMTSIQRLLDEYVVLHKKEYKRKPEYLRVFLARSDPALVSGMLAAVLANRIALSELYQWSDQNGIDVYPWLGAGSLPFRGGLRPDRIAQFLETYPGIRSVSIQSSFRYDFPTPMVKRAIAALNTHLSKTEPVLCAPQEVVHLKRAIKQSELLYQKTVGSLTGVINQISAQVPRRRERRLHIGLLSYKRKMGKHELPRAIPFTAAMYSIGIPPECIGVGRALSMLKPKELQTVMRHYPTLHTELLQAGEYLNKENLQFLAQSNRGFKEILKDVVAIESFLGTKLGPHEPESYIHRNWTSTAYFQRENPAALTEAIIASGKVRKSLG